MTGSTSISNVRVFTGSGRSEPRIVLVVDGVIADPSSEITPDTIVDGTGCTLLPGFIDAHVHLSSAADLATAAQWGVTTMLDMGAPSPTFTSSLRALTGVSDIRSAASVASAAGGVQTTVMGFPLDSIVTSPDDAERFVTQRAADGADYIKIIVENPAVMGPAALTSTIVAALVVAAHKKNLHTVAQASSVAAIRIAVDAWVDVLTHLPLEVPIDAELAKIIAEKGMTAIPTLVMMRNFVAPAPGRPVRPGALFANASQSVASLGAAGVPILVGTDANSQPGSPYAVPHGEALHEEMALLVEAGLSEIEVLRGATSVPASVFGLRDRGAIAPGMRADLVLIEGDPTTDIAATRNLRGVWINGDRVR